MLHRLTALLLVSFSTFSVEITILHTNDTHGRHVHDPKRGAIGIDRIAAYSNALKAQKPTLLLASGDCVAGAPISEFTNGVACYDLMSKAGYDASVLGNHEFDYGWKQIGKYQNVADFPLLSANAFTPENGLMADRKYIIRNAGGVKIGIIGITASNTPNMTTRNGNKGISFGDEKKTLRELVPVLKAKCDLVVILSHCGLEKDKQWATVPGIDFIIGGHSHTSMKQPVKVGKTAIMHAGDCGRVLAQLDIDYDENARKLRSIGWKYVDHKELKAVDSKVAMAVETWKAKLPKGMYENVAVADRNYSEADVKAIGEKAAVRKTGADFGFMNSGGVRDGFYEGSVTVRDVWIAYPFNNTLAIIAVKGGNIKGALLRQLKAKGVELDPQKIYRVVTNSFIAQRPGWSIGRPLESVSITKTSVKDAIVEYLKANKL